MPIDATQAALIGASVGAGASLIGAYLSARVARANSYRQALYAKRIEAYEDLWVALEQWPEPEKLVITPAEYRLAARVQLYASMGVTTTFLGVLDHLQAAIEGRSALDGPDYDAERRLVLESARLIYLITNDSQKIAKNRVLGFLVNDRFASVEVDVERFPAFRQRTSVEVEPP